MLVATGFVTRHHSFVADRHARYRERHRERLRQEQRARREREREDRLYLATPEPRCACCGEECTTFLQAWGERILCRNCAHALHTYGYCPHDPGVGTRLV